jgi:hypothetical protein
MPTSSGQVAVATCTSTWAGASSSTMRRSRPRSCGSTLWCTSTSARNASLVVESQNRRALGARNQLVAEQCQQFDAFGFAENQGIADHRIAADDQAWQKRVVFDVEVHAEQACSSAGACESLPGPRSRRHARRRRWRCRAPAADRAGCRGSAPARSNGRAIRAAAPPAARRRRPRRASQRAIRATLPAPPPGRSPDEQRRRGLQAE